jgi:hypothetical protein
MNWTQLNVTMKGLGEEQVLELLVAERSGSRRKVFLERLHQRYSALRAERERAEIMAEARQARG